MATGLKVGIVATIGAGTLGGAGGIYYLTLNKNIKDTLTDKGIKLISESAEDGVWTIAFKENKNSSELTGLNPQITNFSTLKTWCTTNCKESSRKETELKKVEKLCLIPPSTISEKLEKDKRVYVENWETKLDAIKKDPQKLAKLKAVDNDKFSNIESASNGKDELKSWCEVQKENQLNPANYEETYRKIVDLCV
ncbi:hypothetical protein A6V39_03650 [Candidatus Mycoplasma haematobovis]|uniref:Uncharacterized protein n=1 Tax=Candidatus Mycoplasma haematobovis TaxID=432608 RepID=A0A1A9QD97_9MOLU|nr:hypothetical protein [Candidatus Mycoplasma haematobovis]OAL09981.1 hypothetical protein A6V39_03650 [Candidatus Mycoplasma haematobovis]